MAGQPRDLRSEGQHRECLQPAGPRALDGQSVLGRAAGRPFFDNLGTPESQRKLVIIDANHGVLSYARDQVVGETLAWLDEYLGPVR